ncbi:4168_t:CDS:1 [Funneliformis geosporum]|uniref:710_t:CDS:1 n=1 Tax=Funneliformis geosporum TaxID=1117311 RepID=A0A9W4SX65_9GLOM|nr:710_t:CDS:1 [Funneliformis geosporum]CAI2184008.1 4168_t:CDS:1 [Funneliformis geosporum]
MRPIPTNLVTTKTSNILISPSFTSKPPLNTPGSSPLLRPISSPMTPITPLVLSDPTTTGNWAHYKKDDFFARETGYFFHNHHDELYTTHHYYNVQNYNNDHNSTTQPQVTINVKAYSPPSSGDTTPTNTNPFGHYHQEVVNHYVHMNSHNPAPADPPAAYSHDNLYLNNQAAKIQNQDDLQFHDVITGLNKMDIMDTH